MVNDTRNKKTIDSIRKQLHNVGSCPPAIDPFSREGAQEWSHWTETCRDLESSLREAREVF